MPSPATKRGAVIATVVFIVILGLVFFLAPLTFYTGDITTLSGVNPAVQAEGTTFSAWASFSYAWFGCGEIYSPVALLTTYPYAVQGSLQPYTQTYTLYSGGAWQCK
ncbi:MAG: hypothetical protein JRN68_00055 [Nitrososphaerota archaeon]|nr:hypothetical protein [Nitrososphaerota archaeon]